MSSNEEYLDSLLKAVTSDGQSDKLDDMSGMESEEQEWDGISQNDLEQMLANVENLDIQETNLEEKMPEVYVEDDEAEEKAFSDPGALFFEGEEEYLDEEEIDGSKHRNADDGVDKKADDKELDDFGSLFFEGEEDEASLDADSVEGMSEGIREESDAMQIGEAADFSTNEDITSVSDGLEENEISEDTVDDMFTETDSVEENAATSDNMEEMLLSMDEMEESAKKEEDISVADSVEDEDLIAAADSIEEVSQGATDEPFDDEGFKEINDLLASSDGDDDDMFAMLEGVESADEEAADIGFFDEEASDSEQEEEKSKREKKKKEKKKKKNADNDIEADALSNEETIEEATEKKPGIFTRFMNFLLEEDEEEEDNKKEKEPITEEELEAFSEESVDENAAILEELDKEDAAKKSDKKDKKKKKKGKKGKEEEASSEDGEEDEEGTSGGKGKKAKKEKKKKEKKEKVEEVPAEPTKKLSAKKIEVTAVLCLSILAAVLLIIHLVPPALEKNSAREAYYTKDYEKVVEGFYGEELNESDTLMYQRAYTVLRMQRKIDGYNNFMRMGKETEAVNQLIEGVVRYREIYEEAALYNVTEEIDEIYQTITDALYNKYGITPERAEELYEMEDNFAYTLKLESIIDGVEYELPSDEEESVPQESLDMEQNVPSAEEETIVPQD